MISRDRTSLAPRIAIFAAVIAGLALTPALSAQTVQNVAEVHFGSGGVEFAPVVGHGTIVLTVSGPDGFYRRVELGAGESPFFSLFDEAGNVLPDGVYRYELTVGPAELRRREALDGTQGLDKGSPGPAVVGTRIQSGAFAIQSGALVDGSLQEPDPGAAPGGGSGGNRLVTKDVLHYDDVIITGSLCVGFDCVNGESFGYDTIKLKEHNLRVFFDDTSYTASYPRNDWRIVANDSTNGGASRFSIEDASGGVTPFTIEAGAPGSSLYVEDYGRVGLGTSTPVTELHIKDSDTPTVRLEQDSSGGWTPQTWDLAGNETNFFIRDVTNGSKLSFRIQPGTPSSTLTLKSDGNVGIGTWSPSDQLHVDVTGGNGGVSIVSATNLPQLTLDNTAVSSDDGKWRFRVNSVGNFVFTHADTNSTSPFVAEPEANTNLLVLSGDAVEVTGRVLVNGTQVHPDYVFEPGYELESIEEHAESMWAEKHLPAIGRGAYREDGRSTVDLVGHQFGIVEELEKAHVYIEQVHQELQRKAEELARLEEHTAKLLEEKDAQIEELRVRLEALERR